jgi:integrase
MNTVDAASKAEIDLIHALLDMKFGQLYADIWKIGVNISLRISDLLTLQYSELNLAERSLQLTEQKNGGHKQRRSRLIKACTMKTSS